MSFVTYGVRGLGDGAPAAPGFAPWASSGLTNAGALGLGAQAVLRDPSVASILSPFSVIGLQMVQGAFSGVLEQGLEAASSALISVVPDIVFSTVSDMVSAAVSSTGVGSFFTGVFNLLSTTFNKPSYAGSQDEQRACQFYLTYFATPSSGTLGLDPCTTCPSDIFYPSVPLNVGSSAYPCSYPDPSWGDYGKAMAALKSYKNVHAWNTAPAGSAGVVGYQTPPRDFSQLMTGQCGPLWYPAQNPNRPNPNPAWYYFRPALGQALMLITEGSPFDLYDIPVAERADWLAWQSKAYDQVRQAYTFFLMGQVLSDPTAAKRASWWSTYGGVPPVRRAQFTALRRAIQAAAPQYGTKSDAGLAIWPVYLDLLLNAYQLGQIDEQWIGYALTYQYLQGLTNFGPGYLSDLDDNTLTNADLGMIVNQNWFGDGFAYHEDVAAISMCAQNVASQIMDLLKGWSKARTPATAAGQQKLNAYAKQASAIVTGKKPLTTQSVWSTPIGLRVAPVPVVKRAHAGAAIAGAAAAAAAIYLLL